MRCKHGMEGFCTACSLEGTVDDLMAKHARLTSEATIDRHNRNEAAKRVKDLEGSVEIAQKTIAALIAERDALHAERVALRDEFAKAALQGMLAATYGRFEVSVIVACDQAYAFADGMLAARLP